MNSNYKKIIQIIYFYFIVLVKYSPYFMKTGDQGLPNFFCQMNMVSFVSLIQYI